MTIGDLLNRLSERDYEVEFMISNSGTLTFLLSKKSSSSAPDAIQHVMVDNEEVKEVARYNLQGMPVKKDEKGIQIVVYSNYTTKTIIVE